MVSIIKNLRKEKESITIKYEEQLNLLQNEIDNLKEKYEKSQELNSTSSYQNLPNQKIDSDVNNSWSPNFGVFQKKNPPPGLENVQRKFNNNFNTFTEFDNKLNNGFYDRFDNGFNNGFNNGDIFATYKASALI